MRLITLFFLSSAAAATASGCSEPASGSGGGLELPDLFAAASACDSTPPDAAARRAEEAGSLQSERYVFEAQDGVRAVTSFELAASCYAAAGDSAGADAAREQAAAMKTRIEGEVSLRRLRLERALDRGDTNSALRDLDYLADLLRHLPESDMAIAVGNLGRRLRLNESDTP